MLGDVLFAFCQWSDSLALGNAIRQSVWLFPFIEIFHILGLSVLGGTIWLLNMRLLGVPLLRQEPLPQLARQVWPLTNWSLVLMLVSGYALFTSEAMKDFYNWGFRVKMAALLLAIVFTFTIHRRVVVADEASVAPLWRKLTAIVSFLLWLAVGLGTSPETAVKAVMQGKPS